MSKKLGVVCDDWKAKKFKDRLQREGFTIAVEGLVPIKKSYFFQIVCEDKDFERVKAKLAAVLMSLEMELKRSN
jgi:hypothetical protein